MGRSRRRSAWLRSGCALISAPALAGVSAEAGAAAVDLSGGGRTALLLDEGERRRYEAAGTWHELFDPSDTANALPLLVWAAALVALGLVAFPYLWLVARGLPDAGFAVARPVGLLLVAWPAWWLASVAGVEYGRTSLGIVALLLAAGAALIAAAERHRLRRWLRVRWRVVLASELVFWTLFGAFLTVRWLNPDLWHPSLGGEKPMDLAFLNAVVKSAEFPPYDPWFAGGYINYYYFGFVLVGALVELTGVVPHVAYNLAVPTLAACLGSAAFGAALALVERRRPRRRALVTATLAAAFVVVVGNLGEVEVVVESLRGGVPLDWWYWTASRAVAAPAGQPGPITEFPAFTYLYADLHAHAVALPYTAVVVVLALALVSPVRRRARAVAAGGAALLALVLGALWPTNTWDFPTYGLVVLVVLGVAHVAGGRSAGRGVARAAGLWALVVAAAYVLFLPFHLRYESAFAGVERWRGARTSLADYLTVHGFFLFVIASALVLDLLLARELGGTARLVRLALRRPRRVRRLLRLHRGAVGSQAALAGAACVAAAAVLALVLAAAGAAVPALVLGLATLAVLVSAPRAGLARLLTLALVLIGLALTLAVELAVVSRIDIGRTNTVFKTYLQVWVLWALAAAASLPVVYAHLRRLHLRWRLAWRSAFVVLLAATLLYPALAAPAKVRDRFDRSVGPTLDGMAFMTTATYADRDVEMPLADDLAAMRWMLAEVRGSPVVAELNTAPKLYGWGNRFAMFTGNPAVVGWDFHQRQQRGMVSHDEILARIADIQRVYETTLPEVAHRLLVRRRATYVVVGRLERAYFPAGQAKWGAGAGRLWDRVFSRGGVSVYRVRP